jgi:hypothetical protein
MPLLFIFFLVGYFKIPFKNGLVLYPKQLQKAPQVKGLKKKHRGKRQLAMRLDYSISSQKDPYRK